MPTHTQHPATPDFARDATSPSGPPRAADPPACPAPAWAAVGPVIAVTSLLGLTACGGGGAAEMAEMAGVNTASAAGAGAGSQAPTVGAASVAGAPAAQPAAVVDTVRADGLSSLDAQAARLLLQAQFSASDAEIADVRRLGQAAWLTAQFARPHGETGWDWLAAGGYAELDANAWFETNYAFNFMIWQQVFSAPDAVRKRLSLALSEFMVVSLSSVSGFVWPHLTLAHYWDLLNGHCFGNFRDLLEAVSLSPAMGLNLSTLGNEKEDEFGRQPDENFARELLQLFSIGPHLLNADGTPKRTTSGKPIDSYTQDDVRNLARVFTGYVADDDGRRFTLTDPPREWPYPSFTRRPMRLDPSRHSMREARFLGATVPAAMPADEARRLALDTVFRHPNVGPFFCRQMIQRLVTSHPSPAYVQRVAASFANNGAGVRGDLQAVWRAILLDTEARGGAGLTSLTFGKLREPMLRLAQWGRSFRLRSAQGRWKVVLPGDEHPHLAMSQQPFASPSVFNFYRPGHVPPGTPMAARGATAPEFQIVNESSVCQYVNLMEAVVYDGLYTPTPDTPYLQYGPSDGYDMVPDYTAEIALALNATALVRRLNLLLCAGQLSSATTSIIVRALEATPLSLDSSQVERRTRVAQAVLLVLIAPEYLIQK